MHRWTGGAMIAAVAAHVAGLCITSPPDVADALMAVFRARFRQRLRIWRRGHTAVPEARPGDTFALWTKVITPQGPYLPQWS